MLVLASLMTLACGRASPPAEPPASSPAAAAAPAPTERPRVALTASDGTELELRSVALKAHVDGPLAFSELHLEFVNDEPRLREGTFEIQLPEGASIARFAMQVGGEWQEGEVVTRARGRDAFAFYRAQTTQRRARVRDPALLQEGAASSYYTRIYPIQPLETKRLILSYVQLFADPAAPYESPLSGLEGVQLSHDITVRGREPLRSLHVGRPGEAPVRVDRGDSEELALVREDMLLARVRVPSQLDRGPAPMDGLSVALDTSASSARELDATVDRVIELVESLARATGRDLPVQLIAFDQRAATIYEGPASGFAAAARAGLRERGALGATSLAVALEALAERGAHRRVLIVTDAQGTTAGEESGPTAALLRNAARLRERGAQRVDLLLSSRHAQTQRARALIGIGAEDGLVLGAELTIPELRAALLQGAPSSARVELEGADWVWPRELDGYTPGSYALVFARRAPGAPPRMIPGAPSTERALWSAAERVAISVHARGDEAPLSRAELDATLTRNAAFPHVWLSKQTEQELASLRSARETEETRARREQLLARAVERRLLTRETAWIVLEDDAMYADQEITRHSDAGVLRVDGLGGVERWSRADDVTRDDWAVPTPSATNSPRRGANLTTRARHSPRADGDADIVGRVVHSATGEPIEDAIVILQCPCLQGDRETISNDAGLYRFARLPPGDYIIQVLVGQASVARDVSLGEEERWRVDFSVNPRNELLRTITVDAAGGATVSAPPTFPAVGRRRAGERAATPSGALLVGAAPIELPLPARARERAPKLQLTRAPPGLKQDLKVRLDGLRDCYEQGLALDQRGRGGVTFTATAAGESLDWIAARGHGYYQGAILRCMQSRALEWRFEDEPFTGEFDFTIRIRPGPARDIHDRMRSATGRPPFAVAALDDNSAAINGHLLAGEHDDALTSALSWWRSSPRDPLAALAVGHAAAAVGREALAIRAYGSLIEFAPTRAAALRTAAGYIGRLGVDGQARARAIFQDALALRDTPQTRRQLALALIRSGELADALEQLTRALRATPPRGETRALHQTLAEEVSMVAAAMITATPGDPSPRELLAELGLEPSERRATAVALTWEAPGVDLDLHVWDERDDHASFRAPWLGEQRERGGSFLVADIRGGHGPELFRGRGTPRLDLVVHAYDRGAAGVIFGGASILRLDADGRLSAEWRPFVITRPGGVIGLGHVAPS